MGNIVSPVGTKLGEWCVLVELVARDFWRKYCRYDEGIRLFVKESYLCLDAMFIFVHNSDLL